MCQQKSTIVGVQRSCKAVVSVASGYAVWGVLGISTLLATGCSICCGPYDDHYPAQGGIVERADPIYGRVGSVYSDPSAVGGPSVDSNLRRSPEVDTEPNLDLPDDGPELQSPESMRNGGEGAVDELPPPRLQRPEPDGETSVFRLRSQSRRGVRQWR